MSSSTVSFLLGSVSTWSSPASSLLGFEVGREARQPTGGRRMRKAGATLQQSSTAFNLPCRFTWNLPLQLLWPTVWGAGWGCWRCFGVYLLSNARHTDYLQPWGRGYWIGCRCFCDISPLLFPSLLPGPWGLHLSVLLQSGSVRTSMSQVCGWSREPPFSHIF